MGRIRILRIRKKILRIWNTVSNYLLPLALGLIYIIWSLLFESTEHLPYDPVV